MTMTKQEIQERLEELDVVVAEAGASAEVEAKTRVRKAQKTERNALRLAGTTSPGPLAGNPRTASSATTTRTLPPTPRRRISPRAEQKERGFIAPQICPFKPLNTTQQICEAL